MGVQFALQKFYKFLCGRPFKLIIDNQPLSRILSPEKPLPVMVPDRIVRQILFLRSFSYEVEHRRSALLAPADALSRLPLPIQALPEGINQVQILDGLPLCVPDVARATRDDPILAKVLDYTVNGWPRSIHEPALRAYYNVRGFLSVQNDCLTFGKRVVIPQSLYNPVLELIHEGHPGVVRGKMRAREHVWWPSLNEDIELKCKQCEPCNIVNFKPISRDLVPWPRPNGPMERCHIDFF